ncbi:MAG: response regulator [Myxococcales bacterium]|nr:response regulator [Myxococcales bacterium]
MTSILVVDDDEMLRADVAQELRAEGFDVSEASNVDAALSELGKRPPDVLLTDLRMEGRDGVDLLVQLREVAPHTMPILMSGFATARDYQRATELGAVKVLTKPFTPKEMFEAVQHALDCGTGFRGSVHGISLVDMLQMFHFGQRTIALHISGAADSTIEFRVGEIVDAARGELVGVDALREILATPSGAMRTSVPDGSRAPTIALPFQSLLMDTLREIDETRPGAAEIDPFQSDSQRPSFSMRNSSVDSAFEEWVSRRPEGAASMDFERIRGLRPILDRVAPQMGAAIIDEFSAQVVPLRDFGTGLEWVTVLGELSHDLSAFVTETGFEQFESVVEDLAYAVLRKPGQGYAMILAMPLVDKIAAQRFRSQVWQVATYLPEREDQPG